LHTSRSLIFALTALTLAGAAVSPSSLVVLLTGAVLVLGVWLLWPTNDAPILLLPFGLQWLAVAIKPLQTALTGIPLNNLSDFDGSLTPAVYLSLAALTALAVGLRVGAGRQPIDWNATMTSEAARWPSAMVLPMTTAMIIAGQLFAIVALYMGPFVQIFIALSGIRNVGLFLLAYWCLSQRRSLLFLAAVTVGEIAWGMTGFFAGFREALVVLFVAALAARPRLSFGGVFGAVIVLGLVLLTGIFWSAIKPDYRSFLNQGSGEQVVNQPLAERLQYVGRAADQFNSSQFDDGLRALVARVSYIDFLAMTMRRVPTALPHEDGKHLGEAMLNIITPRILFPNKPPTPNDSEVTARYTGLVLDLSGRTSISIGYLGELYIDFGYAGSVIGTFLIGVFGGQIYALLRSYRGIPLFMTYGITTMATLPFSYFEIDLVRFLGSAVTISAACLVLQRAVAPRALLMFTRPNVRAAA
jgi:hypothetical protein